MTAGSAICRCKLVEAFFELIELLSKLHGGLGDDQFSALRCSSAMAPSSARMATSVWSSAGGLVVMRWSQSPGAVRAARNEPAPLGGIADQFIAEAHDQRQQRDAGGEFGRKTIERHQRVDHHGNHHDHQQETGAAARVKGGEPLGVFHGDRLARFEIEDHFVLRAVIFPDAPHVLPARNQVQEPQEDGDADDAIGGVEGQPAGESG